MTHMELGLQELNIVTDEQRKAAMDALNKLGDSSTLDNRTRNQLEMSIRAALSTPAVPVIEGLEEAIEFWNKQTDWSFDFSQKHIIMQAARAYAALPKMQKVDLEGMKETRAKKDVRLKLDDLLRKGYNAAIDDIKSLYGELYAEVKE